MVPEEHPPEATPVEAEFASAPTDLSTAQDATANDAADSLESKLVVAEAAEVVTADFVAAKPPRSSVVPVARSLDNVAAKGGAIGALVLGGWSIIGAFVTPFSIVNAALGFALGLWGMTSPQFRLAYIGMGLSAIGCLLSLILSA